MDKERVEYYKDRIRSLESERNYWKSLATKMLEIAGHEVPETDGPLLRDDDGKLIGFESVKEDFLRIKKSLESGD